MSERIKELRKRAEEKARAIETAALDNLPNDARQQLLHELLVHQLELEAQNEELRHIQKELESSRARYFDLYNLAPVGYVTLSQQGDILDANLTGTLLLGMVRSALVKQPFTRLLSPDDQDRYYFCRKQLVETGESQACEVRMKRADGSLFWANLQMASQQDSENTPSCRIAICDVTKQKHAEMESRTSREQWDKTFDAMTDIVTIQDKNMRIVRANKAAHKLLQVQHGALQGIYCYELFSGGTQPCVGCPTLDTICDFKDHSSYIHHQTLDKKFHVSSAVMFDENGEFQYYIHVARDVTEQQKIEQKLIQFQKLDAIGQLAAGFAHEINTPLQYVQNNVSFFERAFGDFSLLLTDYLQLQNAQGALLTEEAKSHLESIDVEFLMAEIPESIEEIQEGIGRVVKIISAMKEFSNPGSGERTAIDLNRALESTIVVTINEWKYVAEMVTDFDPDLPMVPCLSDQLNQVILNLIVNGANAIEATGASCPDNPGRITISTRQDNDWVEIRVGDTGGGIPEELRNKIFEPFFTTKEVGKGTGQGLAISHDVVVIKHGGTLDFISDPGKGTTFVIRLPLNPVNNEVIL